MPWTEDLHGALAAPLPASQAGPAAPARLEAPAGSGLAQPDPMPGRRRRWPWLVATAELVVVVLAAASIAVTLAHPRAAGSRIQAPAAARHPVAPGTLSPQDKARVGQVLQASVGHYQAAYAAARAALGGDRYPDLRAGLEAFADPGSPASRFGRWRDRSNISLDTSYLGAYQEAASHYPSGGEPLALDRWRDDMASLQQALDAWTVIAAGWQLGYNSDATLAAAAGRVDTAAAASQADVPAVLAAS